MKAGLKKVRLCRTTYPSVKTVWSYVH